MKGPVSKTGEPLRGSVGSNPTSSADIAGPFRSIDDHPVFTGLRRFPGDKG